MKCDNLRKAFDVMQEALCGTTYGEDYLEGIDIDSAEEELSFIEAFDCNGWLDAKKNPPTEEGWYFVYAPGYHGKNWVIGEVSYSNFNPRYKKPWGIDRGDNSWSSPCFKGITHWRPMFEKPEGVKKNG